MAFLWIAGVIIALPFLSSLFLVISRTAPEGSADVFLKSSAILERISLFLSLILLIVHLCLLYRYWQLIPLSVGPINPANAVGFLFFPIFNCYWVFVAYGKLGKLFNQLTGRNAPGAEFFALTWSILFAVLFIAFFIVSLPSHFYFLIPRDLRIFLLQVREHGALLFAIAAIFLFLMIMSFQKAARKITG